MEKEKKSLVGKFKGLSKKNKIVLITTIIAIVTIVIITIIAIIASNNKSTPTVSQPENIQEEIKEQDNEELSPLVELSDTYTGMSFKVSKEDYEEQYLKYYSNEISTGFADESFSKATTVLDGTTTIYTHTLYCDVPKREYFITGLLIDNNTNKVIGVNCGIDYNNINDTLKTTSMTQVIANMGSLNDGNADEISAVFEEMIANNQNIRYQNGIGYSVGYRSEGSLLVFEVRAMTEEHYKNTFSNNSEETSTTTETNSSEVAGIEQMIGFLNSYYDLGFNPTDEQMQEIIEFSNTTDEFNNDTLMEFILQKGWTVSGTGTIDNSSGTTSNSNNSSSNNNNTNKNSNDSNTSTYKEIKATLSINIKDLINNSTDPEVETILQSNTLQVSIFVEESEEKSEYLMYHGGIDSIPNTITQEFTFKTTNNKSIKSNVRIVIDNTSTMIRESTLYDKSIIFDKTGTYTIK